jgi:hypothetical protein
LPLTSPVMVTLMLYMLRSLAEWELGWEEELELGRRELELGQRELEMEREEELELGSGAGRFFPIEVPSAAASIIGRLRSM